MSGTLFVVATPIGNLEDITLRALRVLRDAAVIAAEDTRRTAHLLARHGITTPTTSLHEHNETVKSAKLISRLHAGDSIALVSDAGTPTVSDPGGVLIRAAIEAGIRVESIPGPSAVLAVLAVSGLPTDSFSFMGFPPVRSSDRQRWFERVKKFGGTIVFFESPHRIEPTLRDFVRVVGDCEGVIGREMTKKHEELVRGPISLALGKLSDRRGEFVVAILLGQMTDTNQTVNLTARQITTELGELTKIDGVTKRKAINVLSKRYGIPPNELYARLEAGKLSGE